MVNHTRFVRRRLQNLGVSREHAEMTAKAFQRQVSEQGLEGATSYFKSVGDALLNYLYGSPKKPAWVLTTRSGYPKILSALRGYGEDILIRVSKLARVLRLELVSRKQVAKVTTAPGLPFEGQASAVDRMTSIILDAVQHFAFANLRTEFSYQPDKVGYHFSRILSTAPELAQVKGVGRGGPDYVRAFTIVGSVPELQVQGWEKAFWPLDSMACDKALSKVVPERVQHVGEIHAAQEGGAKLRLFAAPYTVVQCILSPIHDYLAGFRDRLVSDCTGNQMSGAEWARGKMLSGRTIHSVDLSTATCRFPLEPQLALIRELGVPEDYVDALIWACRGTWSVGRELRKPFNRSTLQWVVGQPLGIRPSMSMFSLAHNLLLAGLALEIGIDPEDSFRVLGDDVVISDTRLHRSYVNLIQQAGVPISWNKCHNSRRVAEFAGATISKTAMLRPGQWRSADITNALSIADGLGSPTYGEVTKTLEKMQEVFLFMDGRFTPPPEDWPVFLRISATLKVYWLDNFRIANAPYRYYKAMTHIRGQLRGLGKLLGFDEPTFVYENPSALNAAFKPVFDAAGPEHHDFVMSVKGTNYWCADQAALVGASALTTLEALFSAGAIGPDQFETYGEQIITNIHGLLWLELPKNGRERMLRRLTKRLNDVMQIMSFI